MGGGTYVPARWEGALAQWSGLRGGRGEVWPGGRRRRRRERRRRRRGVRGRYMVGGGLGLDRGVVGVGDGVGDLVMDEP